ncbi:MAG: Gldg family protein [Thermodesulfobacteriota bacterium]
MTSHYARRKLVLGGGTALGAVVFLAILIGLQYVSLQHPKKWDVTRTGQYTLAPQTKKVLQSFGERKTPIEVLAFYRSGETGARQTVRDLLDQYKEASKVFTYAFIDPDVDRPLAVKHKVETYQTLVIKAGDKDLLVSAAGEEAITNALVKLLKPQEKKVYFVEGHGERSPADAQERGISRLKEQIEKENYKVAELILAHQGDVPGDATMVMIVGPKEDPLEQEIEAIRRYVKKGGKLMVFLNPFSTPKLAALLQEFGIESADDLVIDPMSQKLAMFGGSLTTPLITKFKDFPITKDFAKATVMTMFPDTRSVGASKKPVAQANPTELAMSSEASWSIDHAQYKTGKADLDEKTSKKGPFSVICASTYTIPPGEAAKELGKESGQGVVHAGEPGSTGQKSSKARIVVFGSSLVAANRYLATFKGNRDLIMNSVSWLAEEEDLISIRPKPEKAEILMLSDRQYLLMIGVLLFAPMAWLVLGLMVYSYRKRTVTP